MVLAPVIIFGYSLSLGATLITQDKPKIAPAMAIGTIPEDAKHIKPKW